MRAKPRRDPDRRGWLLQRPWDQGHAWHVPKFPLVGELVLGPDTEDDLKGFVEPLKLFLNGDFKAFEFVLPVAKSNAKVDAPA